MLRNKKTESVEWWFNVASEKVKGSLDCESELTTNKKNGNKKSYADTCRNMTQLWAATKGNNENTN